MKGTRMNSRMKGARLPKGVMKQTMGRLLRYMFRYHKAQLIVVGICIVFSSLSTVASSIFLKTLIDDGITPALINSYDIEHTFRTMLGIVGTMAAIYLTGIASSFVYTRIMAIVTQSVLCRLREDMFRRMQTLPIKYFDTNNHGDIMSYYTNDIDALRQLLSQSIPQMMSSTFSVVALLIVMLTFSLWLTLAVLACVVFMFWAAAAIGGRSAKYFIRQQNSLGVVEGFIEEILHGQKKESFLRSASLGRLCGCHARFPFLEGCGKLNKIDACNRKFSVFLCPDGSHMILQTGRIAEKNERANIVR